VLAREVYTIEIVPELDELRRANLERLGYSNSMVADGPLIRVSHRFSVDSGDSRWTAGLGPLGISLSPTAER
jgi:hypothetical protein